MVSFVFTGIRPEKHVYRGGQEYGKSDYAWM